MRAIAVYGLLGPLGVLVIDLVFSRTTGDVIDWGDIGFLLWPTSILGIGLHFAPIGIAFFVFLNFVVCMIIGWMIVVLLEACYVGLNGVRRMLQRMS